MVSEGEVAGCAEVMACGSEGRRDTRSELKAESYGWPCTLAAHHLGRRRHPGVNRGGKWLDCYNSGHLDQVYALSLHIFNQTTVQLPGTGVTAVAIIFTIHKFNV